MKDYIKYALELYQEGNKTKAQIAREVKVKFNLDSDIENLRKRISKKIIELEHSGLARECDTVGAPITGVSHYWVKTDTHSTFVKVEDEERLQSILSAVSDIVANYNPEKVQSIKKVKIDSPVAIKATVSDMHVGLEPNPGGTSLFAYEYNEIIFKQNLDKVFNSICKEFDNHGRFDLLVIDDLGDGLDGWNGQTTRGGHGLDQNMNNEEKFKLFEYKPQSELDAMLNIVGGIPEIAVKPLVDMGDTIYKITSDSYVDRFGNEIELSYEDKSKLVYVLAVELLAATNILPAEFVRINEKVKQQIEKEAR